MQPMENQPEVHADAVALAHEHLSFLRAGGSQRLTEGLGEPWLGRFIREDSELRRALAQAAERRRVLEEAGQWAEGDELAQVQSLQAAYVNFYSPDTVNPYVALSAAGPWIITAHGAVLHDSGGYGMLGLGHDPREVIEAMSGSWVMANIMTPSISHMRFSRLLRCELSYGRSECPFDRFICMNSGSESVTVASRIADVNAHQLTQPGARHEGKRRVYLSLSGSFHGRTDRPAHHSDSCRGKYSSALASFAAPSQELWTTPPNDVEALEATFARAEAEGVFIESFFIEPVMGEGNPGEAVQRAFYDRARELTREHGALFLVDSIQAGLRGQGCLSLMGYPGFEDASPPDMETYSKALNAGQYPLSVLALTQSAADLYVTGIYGNTMTTNPRALEVACVVLEQIDEGLRENIRARGRQLVQRLKDLREEFPGMIREVRGTGLLLCAELDPAHPVVAPDGVERTCRERGLGVIHGGRNALRFTPHFRLTEQEVELMIGVLREVLAYHRDRDGAGA